MSFLLNFSIHKWFWCNKTSQIWYASFWRVKPMYLCWSV